MLGGYILKVHSTYVQVGALKRENKYSVLSQHLSTATRAVEYSPPHYVGKESRCILHRFRPSSPVKPEKKRAVGWEELVGDATGSAEWVEGG